MIHLGDITKIEWCAVPPVDCVTGGSPCQDLSVAGKRAGLSGERSGLFMEQIKCVKELRKQDEMRGRTGRFVRPRYMVWENVPGAFSSNGGKDFQAVLTEISRIVQPDAPDVPMPDNGKWTKSGCLYGEMGNWSIAWRVHDAQFWGVAQRRKRIALVADFGGLSAPEILFERKRLSRNPEPGGKAWQETPGAVGGGAYNAISIQGNTIDRDVKQNGTGVSEGVSHTLNAVDRHGVMQNASETISFQDQQAVMVAAVDCRNGTENSDINGTLQAKSTGGIGVNFQNVCRIGSFVRRITPLECERLQGYPDGWTDIGDWVDSNGKKHKAADSPRYKALGNSIALPFWFWLLRRISAQYERPATLGSLFDGIGGFPLCWERCNGHGTAVWASEIEEFPIAVTKKRFPCEKEVKL